MQPVQAVRDLDMAQHRRIFEINYFATVEIVTLCIPILLDAASKHGRKATVGIATSNADWERVLRGLCGYCDSKAALSRFIKVLAHEERDIHTVGLYPGVTHTPMVDLILDGAYTDVMYPEETAWYTDMKTNKWHRPGGIELPELPARALVKIACGNIAGIESGDIRTWEGFQLD
jgi:NAD(P)-dependent dehydrogenase (short-subunit alcohol dehydrogenase family)